MKSLGLKHVLNRLLVLPVFKIVFKTCFTSAKVPDDQYLYYKVQKLTFGA